ncbi:hypothetical protein ACRALDRAFT_1067299 [Sodiomyces alcalophilus JCM 7366]|uniref:uncharacterized protein n=1 Tax=Sodiomyces alcalophilus JCM 7366 TaxID=591952 RepID=UPI0039B5928F
MRGNTRHHSRLHTRDAVVETKPLAKLGPTLPPGDQLRSDMGIDFYIGAATIRATGAALQPRAASPTGAASQPGTASPTAAASPTGTTSQTGAASQTGATSQTGVGPQSGTSERGAAAYSPAQLPGQSQSVRVQSHLQPPRQRETATGRPCLVLDEHPTGGFADTTPAPVHPAIASRQAHTDLPGTKGLRGLFPHVPKRIHPTTTSEKRLGSPVRKPQQLTRSGLRASGNRRPEKPLPSLPSRQSTESRCASGAGCRRSAAGTPIPTQQPIPAPRDYTGSAILLPSHQPPGDATRELGCCNHRRLSASFRSAQPPRSKPTVDTTTSGGTGVACHSSSGRSAASEPFRPPPARAPASEGQSEFANGVQSATQSIRTNMNYPRAPPPKQRLLPKSRALAAISNLTASISRTSLSLSVSSSERKMSSSSRLPLRSPSDSAQAQSLPSAVSTGTVPAPRPNEITAAQPSPYWTGRFMALQDHFRSRSCLASESLDELVRARRAAVAAQPRIRPAGITHSNTTMALTTLSRLPSASSPHLYPKPVSVSNPLANSTSRRVPTQEGCDEDDTRTLAVFASLEGLCVTDEAKLSL